MNNYSRFVSYMYLYVEKKKEQNIGFARVELRDRIIRLTVNVANVMIENPICELYFIKRGTNERIYIGNSLVKNGQLMYKTVLKEDSLGINCTFDDIIGIIILNNAVESVVFATVWVEEETDIFTVTHPKMIMPPVESVVEEHMPEEGLSEEDSGQEEPSDMEVAWNESVTAVSEDESTGNREEINQGNEVKIQSVEEKKDFLSPFRDGVNVNAFCDDYYYDLVEIAPEDIDKLPDCMWKLKNNSFVMHGYYNYRHLLCGRVANNPDRCFIGVPGTYHNTERYMAAMFGFDRFKCSHRSDVKIQGFGYWYMEADI